MEPRVAMQCMLRVLYTHRTLQLLVPIGRRQRASQIFLQQRQVLVRQQVQHTQPPITSNAAVPDVPAPVRAKRGQHLLSGLGGAQTPLKTEAGQWQ